MKNGSLRIIAFALVRCSLLTAQPADHTQLKQVIIVGRHSVRAAVEPNRVLNTYSVRPYPVFSVPRGILTPSGAALETILGGYYRSWLTKEGFLTGNGLADANRVYFRAKVLERTIDTARAFALGMFPEANVPVDHYSPTQSDPLFDPVGAGVALLEQGTAVDAVRGRLGGDAQPLASVYASELALTRSVLFNDPVTTASAPATPAGKVDITTIPFHIGPAGQSGWPVDPGGLTEVLDAVDPFVMEYADGMPTSDVASWLCTSCAP